MDVFISSVIAGYEHYRAAVAEAVETLGHRVIRAEDFAASPGTPQQACLEAVRRSDIVVLLLGADYGAPQASGLSATHEEYREARESKPVLVFVEADTARDAAQADFLAEVQAWTIGHFRASFANVAELKGAVLRALHEYALATSAAAVDEEELIARARALLPGERQTSGAGPLLGVAVAGAPYQQVVRPAALEDSGLARDLQREALFGEHSVLDAAEGTQVQIRGNALVLEQSAASVLLDETGGVRVVQPAIRQTVDHVSVLPALIEEDVAEAVLRALRFVSWVLDRVDTVRRLTDVVVAVQLIGSGYLPWRTRAEQQASPQAGTIAGFGDAGGVVLLTPARRHRQALTHDADRIASDLVTLLRRERRT